MKKITLILLLVYACVDLQAQTNFVKNPSLEMYSLCPNSINQINLVNYWSMPKDSTTTSEYCPEYFNVCGNDSVDYTAHIPINTFFYGYPHSGNGMAGGHLFYDKTSPPPPGYLPFNYRDNLVGRLHQNLNIGKTYCISFWVVLAETSGIAHNKIGAYLDDGTIHSLPDTLGNEITSVKPQVFTNDVIKDTLNWTKIEGSFTASGTEKYITIGNFFPNDSVTTFNTGFILTQYSYYLIDDVSVIPIDLDADAGKDSHAEPGKPVQIGRVGDTTAEGLDCKWYYKGMLIDSGAIISVNGSAIVGSIDTYVVVQTICGLVKTDTVTVITVPLGLPPLPGGVRGGYSVYPNPSNGTFTITQTNVNPKTHVIPNAAQRNEGSLHATVYDVLGRVVYRQTPDFTNGTAILNVQAAPGVYILELADAAGNATHKRIIIE